MLITIIQYVYYTLFLLVPLVMTSNTSELFEFNKMLSIYAITAIVLFCWSLIMIVQKKIIFKRTFLDIPISLFLLSQIASGIFSIDRHTSFFGYYGRFNGGILSLFCYVILYYGLVTFFNNKKILSLLKVSVVSSVVVILWGLPGRFGYDLSCFLFAGQLNNNCWTDQFKPAERMFSTLGQPNWLGAYLSIHFFIALYFLLRRLKSKSKEEGSDVGQIVFSIYILINFTAILFTRSRSSLFATLVGLGIVFLLVRQKLVIILGLVLVLPILIFKTGIPTIDKLFEFSKKNINIITTGNTKTPTSNSGVTESFDIRKIVWKGAVNLGLKYPLFGTGVETFAYSYYFVRPQAHNLTSEWDFLYNKAHNEFLNYFGTTGFTGLGAYLIMLGGVYILLLKKSEDTILNYSLIGAYSSILITNFFGFSTTTTNLFLFLIPAFSIVKGRLDDEILPRNVNGLDVRQVASLVISSVILIITLIYLGGYFFADIQYAGADSESKKGNYQTSAVLLDRAIKLKYEHVYLDKFSNILANLAVQASYQKKADITQQLMSAAEKYNVTSLNDSPKNILYWKTRAKNQYLFYQITLDSRYIKEAIKAINYARELAPTDAKLPYNSAIFYSLIYDEVKDKNDKEQNKQYSLNTVAEAIKLKPNYRDAYYIKGQLLKRYGDKAGSLQSFKYIIDHIDPSDSEVLKELQ